MTYRQLMMVIVITCFCLPPIDTFAARIPTRLIENVFKIERAQAAERIQRKKEHYILN